MKLKKFKKQFLLLIGIVFPNCCLFAQKSVIDTTIYGKWPSVKYRTTKISNDGNYIVFTIENQPVGSATTVVKSVNPGWETSWNGRTDCEFSDDNRKYVFMRHDSLGIGTLGNSEIRYVQGVVNFMLLKKDGNNFWLAYRLKTTAAFVLYDLQSGKEQTFADIQNFWPNATKNALVLQTKDDNGGQQLKTLFLTTNQVKTIWFGKLSGYPIWDNGGTSIAFTGIAKGDSLNAVYYYQNKSNVAKRLMDKNVIALKNSYDITRVNVISKDGNSVIVTLREKAPLVVKSGKNKPVSIDIYSYKDLRLQSEQLKTVKEIPEYRAIINVNNNEVIWMEKKGVKILNYGSLTNANSDYVLIDKMDNNAEGAGTAEWNWNINAKHSIELLNVKNGKINTFSPALQHIKFPLSLCQFSPNGKYVLWFNPLTQNYFSMEIATGGIHNLTGQISRNWSDYDAQGYSDRPADKLHPVGIAGFLPNDRGALIYDLHDIYQVDLSGKIKPLCLTDGEGQRQKFRFRLAMYLADDFEHNIITQTENEPVLVNAFDLKSKKDGFYYIHLNSQNKPKYLTMQSYILDGLPEYEVGGVKRPIKARDANVYIVQRQSTSEAPNLLFTTDFKNFKRLTDIAPQKGYNWLTSELITWKTLNGTTSKGILYKPENFDQRKKYPVIFYYYEKFSNSLNRFLEPDANGADIDIPSFVSNGYMVFVPDIHYPLNTGQGYGCYNTVISAAKYLSKMSWVDTKHLGINGHSRGGFQTDYLVTHTHLFAAAISASGYSDAINLYGRIREATGDTRQFAYEMGPQRIGATPWQRPDLYRDGSPVLKADQVTTPILLMNNKEDSDIPFEQGAEFFTALRRLGKKAWMLQYDGQDHVIFDKAAAIDFQVRMQQFFDYYLKGASPPVWMTRGVPAKLKGIDNGLAIDSSGQIP